MVQRWHESVLKAYKTIKQIIQELKTIENQMFWACNQLP